jgi:hypothetical protein
MDMNEVWQAVRTVLMALGVGLVCAFLWITTAHGQTLVPAEVKPAGKGERCFPGVYGTAWPGAKFDLGTRTDNGWLAFVWCKAPDGGARYMARVCVHGECAAQATYWATGGTLIVQSVGGKPRAEVADDWMLANPIAYECPVWPAGGQQPAPRPIGTPQFPDPATDRFRICADLLIAMRADWPMVPATAPPPPPPPPAAGWTAYGGTIFKVVAGKLSTVVGGKTAVKGAPCTGTTIATAGTFVYQALTGGPADEGTRCIKP